MKKIIFTILLTLATSNSFATGNSKLGELPRSSDIDKEILTLLPRSTKDWISLGDILSGPNKTFTAKSKKYSIKSGAEEPDSGDLVRYKYTLSQEGKKTTLGDGPLAWVHISKDERFIFYEPLVAIDTKTWSTKDIAKTMNKSGYFKLLKYSPSLKKIIVAQFDCTVDCPKTDKYVIWEIPLK